MFRKIKTHLEYRKNKRIAKREFYKTAAALLPAIRRFSEKKTDIVRFVNDLAEDGKNLQGEALINMVIGKVADKLETDQPRLVEILKYMAGLSPENMQEILVHSMVESKEGD